MAIMISDFERRINIHIALRYLSLVILNNCAYSSRAIINRLEVDSISTFALKFIRRMRMSTNIGLKEKELLYAAVRLNREIPDLFLNGLFFGMEHSIETLKGVKEKVCYFLV